MKIALVTYALQVGGIETFLKLMVDYFREKGHNVDIIETQAVGHWSNSFSEQRYNVLRVLSNPLQSRVHQAQVF